MDHYNKALIVGYGSSGRAAERLLHDEGTEVHVLDEKTAGWPELSKALADHDFDVCIVSPGFSLNHVWMRGICSAGIPLCSELELGWSRHKGRTVAVTGSNGKSTAVKWIYGAFQHAGINAALGGNYGIPACEIVMDHPELDWLVLEVSSFQLETVRRFRADVAVLLNVNPNHLDRHETMECYRQTKARIFGSTHHPSETCLVPNEYLETIQADMDHADGRKWFTFGNTSEADYVFRDGSVYLGSGSLVNLSETLFNNPILGGSTGSAVVAAAHACGIPLESVETAARNFEPLPHRIQQVGELGGIRFVNDSKATNLAAVEAALRACDEGIHLIAGGVPKESDYTFIKEILAERVRSIYLIGQASRAMYQAWNGVCPCVECGTLEAAFGKARNAAQQGETILLSPGCASFDQFRNFEERGNCFTDLFQEMVRTGGDAA